MTNQAILEKAIRKARKNGWDKEHADMVEELMKEKAVYFQWVKASSFFIFNHDFCRTLWGEEPHAAPGAIGYGITGDLRNWAWHLQQMVVSEDPIKYLGKHLDV